MLQKEFLDSKIYRQTDMTCGESCIIAASDFLSRGKCRTRDQFSSKLEMAKTFLDKADADPMRGIVDLNHLAVNALNLQSRVEVVGHQAPVLGAGQAIIIKLVWNNWSSNAYWPARSWEDQQHFIWILETTPDGRLTAWEPSFAERRQDAGGVQSSPIWYSCWDDIRKRNAAVEGHTKESLTVGCMLRMG